MAVMSRAERQQLVMLDAIAKMDDVIAYARVALSLSFEQLAADGISSDAETYLVQALHLANESREAFVAAAEADV